MSKAIDRATAFKNEISGQGTYKIVCKASNHDLAGPKKKHVDFLIELTNNPKSQMSMIGDLLSERLKDKNWVVVFKTLILSHNLMTLGHERFLQSMATRGQLFTLEGFSDRTDTLAIQMTSQLRKYANYLRALCQSYKALATDAGRMPKGDKSPFINMDGIKVLKAADIIQKQLDSLLELELTSGELTNGVINTAFLMLYKDLVKLYTVYNDCMINLLEKFFEMKKPQCKETIEFYRRFLTRQEGVQTFLQLAETVGIDKQTHLNLRQVPEDLLPALENHVSEMDSIRKANSGEASPSIRAASEKLAALRTVEKKSPLSATPTSPDKTALPSASSEVLEAQRKRFEELKRQASIPKSMNSITSTGSSPFEQTEKTQSASDDLLGLDGSFSTTQNDPWKASPSHEPPSTSTSNPFQPAPVTTQSNGSVPSELSDPWSTTQAPQAPSAYQEVDFFSEIRSGNSGGGSASFDAVFSSQPAPSQISAQFPIGGDILTPQAAGPLASRELLEPTKATPGLTQDVESSLAKAAANLSMSKPSYQPQGVHIPWAVDLGTGSNRAGVSKKTEHMWTAPKESVKTGGNYFQRPGMQARTLDPVNSTSGASVDWNKGMYGGHFPQQYPTVQPMGPPMGNPMMAPQYQPGMMQQQQPFGMQPGPHQMMPPQGGNPWHSQQQQTQQSNDPFGTIPSQNASFF